MSIHSESQLNSASNTTQVERVTPFPLSLFFREIIFPPWKVCERKFSLKVNSKESLEKKRKQVALTLYVHTSP